MRNEDPNNPKSDPVKKGDRASRRRRGRWIALIVLLCLIALGIYFCTGSRRAREAQKPVAIPGIPVVAVQAKKTDFPVYLIGLGTVTPLKTVTIHTRVDGQLMEVLYKEGQMVNAGDLVATLDPRPYEVQLTQAEGQFARDVAYLKNAQLDLERYKVLWRQDSIPKQQLDTQESLVQQYEGIVKNDQGQIDSAKLQLVYCRITAPVSGRIGLRLVDEGNIVHATDTTGLFVITQMQPMTVIFPIPEDSLPQVLGKIEADESLAVEAYDRDMKQKLDAGTLLTTDNQIDTTTGTVRLKAIFPNEKNVLFPNQFVNARLLVEVQKGAIVVPAPALQRGPQGTFVYVVKPDRTATVRPITVSEIEEGNMAVKTGLQAGELVVVDGAERLREGARVEPKPQGTAPSPAAARGP